MTLRYTVPQQYVHILTWLRLRLAGFRGHTTPDVAICFDVCYCCFPIQHWDVFKDLPQLYVLVPALLGLKGNLEMTLASRLSTQVSQKRNFGNKIIFRVVTVIAEIFVRDLTSYISYFWLKVRNLEAYENHARIQVYVKLPSLYENL